MNINTLLSLKDDDPWTCSEFAAVLRYLLMNDKRQPLSQREIVDTIGQLIAIEAEREGAE